MNNIIGKNPECPHPDGPGNCNLDVVGRTTLRAATTDAQNSPTGSATVNGLCACLRVRVATEVNKDGKAHQVVSEA